LELRCQRLVEAARLPTRATEGDAGLDLYAAETAVLDPAGGRGSIGTGIAVEIPPGHAGLVLPRSGNAARHGITLTNAPGLIDSGYRGELLVLLVNLGDAPHRVEPGDRVAQLVITPVSPATPREVAELPASDGRGEGGFGSTGS